MRNSPCATTAPSAVGRQAAGSARLLLTLLLSQAACAGTCSSSKADSTQAVTATPVKSACQGADCNPKSASQREVQGPAASPANNCPEGMVEIPPGTFTMGHPDALKKPDQFSDTGDGPPHQVTLTKPYCLDRTEVTVADYRTCLEAGRCTEPQGMGYRCRSPEDPPDPRYEDHPANCLTWLQAENYCAQQGKRLPTEAEWEYAARGTDGRLYPWGNETDFERRGPKGQTGPAGGYNGDVSPFGVRGMGDNVSEWVWDWYVPYSPDPQTDPRGPLLLNAQRQEKGYRGASFETTRGIRASALRRHRPPSDDAGGRLGVRCARDVGGDPLGALQDAQLAALWLYIQVRRETPQSFDLSAPTPSSTETWANVCHFVPDCARGCERSLAKLADEPPRFGEGRCHELEGDSEQRVRAELERRLKPLLERARSSLAPLEREALECQMFLAGFSKDQEPCFQTEVRWLIDFVRQSFFQRYSRSGHMAKILCGSIPSCALDCRATLNAYPANKDQVTVARNGCREIREKVHGLSDEAAVKKLYAWGFERLQRYFHDLLKALDPKSQDAHYLRCWMYTVKLSKLPEPHCEDAEIKVSYEIPDWLK